MPLQDEKYNLKFTSDYWSKDDLTGFLRGHGQLDSMESAIQYVLLNLSNVTLVFVKLRDATASLRAKKTSNTTGDPIFDIVFTGSVDTVISPFEGQLCELVHLTPPYAFEEYKIITIVKPTISDGKRFSLAGIEGSVWMTLLISLLVLSLVCGILKINFFRFKFANRFRCLEYIWYYASNLLLNTPDTFPRQLSAKLLLSGWILGTMVIIKAYTGNLKSEFMISKNIRIDKLEDLKMYPGTRPALDANGVFGGYAMDHRKTFPLMDKMLKEAVFYREYHPALFQMFRNGTPRFYFVSTPSNIKDAFFYFYRLLLKLRNSRLGAKRLSLYFGEKTYLTKYGHFIFNKKLPRSILDEVNYLTGKYFETALDRRKRSFSDFNLRTWLAKDKGALVTSASAQTIDEVSLMFLIWICGISVASICLFFEILFFQVIRRNSKKPSNQKKRG